MKTLFQISSDFSNDTNQIRQKIYDKENYFKFLKNLKPNYKKVYIDILIGYFAVFLSIILSFKLIEVKLINTFFILLISINIGFWIAYITLFLHEASHFNLSKNKKINNVLSNIFIGWFSGTEVNSYRKIHFEHHKHLGETTDTETSYFEELNSLTIIKFITGIHSLKTFNKRNKTLQKNNGTKNFSMMYFFISLILHVFILLILLNINIYSAISWILGVWCFFPLFAALRQLLEHRDENANPNKNYSKENHGAITRIFGDDLFSSFLGGAGFNRHLLHHWEPQISYTRLKNLEKFLLSTEVANIINSRRSTYWKTITYLMMKKSDS